MADDASDQSCGTFAMLKLARIYMSVSECSPCAAEGLQRPDTNRWYR